MLLGPSPLTGEDPAALGAGLFLFCLSRKRLKSEQVSRSCFFPNFTPAAVSSVRGNPDRRISRAHFTCSSIGNKMI